MAGGNAASDGRRANRIMEANDMVTMTTRRSLWMPCTRWTSCSARIRQRDPRGDGIRRGIRLRPQNAREKIQSSDSRRTVRGDGQEQRPDDPAPVGRRGALLLPDGSQAHIPKRSRTRPPVPHNDVASADKRSEHDGTPPSHMIRHGGQKFFDFGMDSARHRRVAAWRTTDRGKSPDVS